VVATTCIRGFLETGCHIPRNEKALQVQGFFDLERAKGIEPFCLVCRSVAKRVVVLFSG